MTFIYAFPAWLFLACAIALFTLAACGGHAVVRKLYADRDFREHNEVAGFIYAVVGVMYAVLLGFVVVVVWEQFDASDERAQQEVAATAFAFAAAGGLPQPAARDIRAALRRYVDAVVDREWPAMRHGGISAEAGRELDGALAAALRAARLRTEPEVPSGVLTALRDVAQARLHRIDDNQSGLPWLLWSALWIGAMVVIGFSYMFGLRALGAQLLMTAAMAIVIATLFTVIAEFDYPFRGDIAVSDERWIGLRSSLPPP